MTPASVLEVDGRRVSVTHLDRLLWPEAGIRKADYLVYLARVAPYLLPHLAGRPLVLTRYPEGVDGPSFYQKDAPAGRPHWVRTFVDEGRRRIHYVVVDDLATLLWLGNLDCLELHPWLSPAASPDFPDFAVFDLDPAPPAGFEEARQLAFDVRRLLERWALRGYPKLSGATGVHVYVPLLPRYSYAVVRQFVLGTAQLLLRLRPERVTLERRVHRRAGRVYLDYLQNVRGKTIVAAYSPRPLPGAPVSLPVTWRELERVQPDEATLLTVPARLAGRGDPFAQVLTDRQSIDEALRSLGGGCS